MREIARNARMAQCRTIINGMKPNPAVSVAGRTLFQSIGLSVRSIAGRIVSKVARGLPITNPCDAASIVAARQLNEDTVAKTSDDIEALERPARHCLCDVKSQLLSVVYP